LTAADTLGYAGLDFDYDSAAGASGFEVTGPTPGTWKIRVVGTSNVVPVAFELSRFLTSGLELVGSIFPTTPVPGQPLS